MDEGVKMNLESDEISHIQSHSADDLVKEFWLFPQFLVKLDQPIWGWCHGQE
jgi:hypothetical protein